MDMQAAIRTVTERHDLGGDEMADVMRLIMTGQATPAQIGGFLIGLRMKGETVTEITAASTFYPAEEYHQRYFEKNGGGYCKA